MMLQEKIKQNSMFREKNELFNLINHQSDIDVLIRPLVFESSLSVISPSFHSFKVKSWM